MSAPRPHGVRAPALPGRLLHVAAMPFPTHQGSQAAVHHMLDACTRAGVDTHLLSYASGSGDRPRSYRHHRIGDFPRVRSLRSGPSVGKLALDFRLALAVPRVARRLAPEVVVAHHVEAALCCLGRRSALFFAHTDLAPELPTYLPRLPGAPLSRLGAGLDAALAWAFGVVAAVSPLLAERLRCRLPDAVAVRYVPLPWTVPPPVDASVRAAARAERGLDADTPLLLYTGNLDAYQGWTALPEMVARVRAAGVPAVLLVATGSDAAALHAATRAAGVADAVRVESLGGEDARRRMHAAADLAVVPRVVEGGLPIKLLDALARGVHAVTTPAGAAGLPLGDAATVASDASATALAHSVRVVLAASRDRTATAQRARDYVARHHDDASFLGPLAELCSVARQACGGSQVSR